MAKPDVASLYVAESIGSLRKQPGLDTRRVDWHLNLVQVTSDLKFIRVNLKSLTLCNKALVIYLLYIVVVGNYVNNLLIRRQYLTVRN